jgi:Iron-containing redox enzyme
MLLPQPRGPLTEALNAALRGDDSSAIPPAPTATDDPLLDEDIQLALWISYELHYRGFDDVAPTWEWEPALLFLRRDLETAMLDHLHRVARPSNGTGSVPERLQTLVAAADGPSVARFVQRRATPEHVLEFAVHRSIYHLKEADGHSWAIPRLSGRAKAALVEIQADEYGGGDPALMHSEMFRRTLRGLGLDDTYGHYVDAVPALTLASNNLISLLGLHRELRGALVGHLAVFEMTSAIPSRRFSQGLRRLGYDESIRRFYDVHVTADALHEQLALHDLCGGLAEAEPDLADDVLFGAAACIYVETRFAEHLLGCWESGRTSLRDTGLLSTSAIADVS